VRLVHLADYGGPYAGSFVYMLRTVLLAARSRGWEAEAVFGTVAKDRPWLPVLRDEGIPVSFVAPRPREEARAALEPLFGSAPGPMIVHTHFTGFDIPAAQVIGRRAETGLVWHNHMGVSRNPRVVASNVLKYALFGNRVDQILCAAPDAVDAAKRRGAPRKRIRFLPNGIDTTRFPLISMDERAAARADLGVPSDVPLLLHFAWDWHIKGGDVLLAAARELRSAGRPVVVATVGGGDQARDLASELEIEDAVLPLEPRARVRDLLAAADVFVSCSRTEATNYSVAEALCCGIPVVATRIPGLEWIAPDQPARRLVDLDPSEVAAAVRGLLDRPASVAARERFAARDWVIEHVDLESWTERLLHLYAEILPGVSAATAVRSD
jgi:glycosyltransferase involved in cell wall biosynthesis